MMKKLFSVTVLIIALQVGASNKAAAQKGTNYKNAVGMRIDFGSDYGTYAGISGKHFFDARNVGEAQLLFGNNSTMINLEYQYHADMPNAAGLKWYAGIGPGFTFSKKSYHYGYYYSYYSGGGTDVLIRPTVGLDYKVNDVPLNFSFDWRPAFVVTHGTDFSAARFGLAARYAF
jgi:hypothetical protein